MAVLVVVVVFFRIAREQIYCLQNLLLLLLLYVYICVYICLCHNDLTHVCVF